MAKKMSVNMSKDKETVATRTERAATVGKVAPNSAIYQQAQGVQQAADDLEQAGLDLAVAQAKVKAAQQNLALTLSALDTQVALFDATFGVYAAQVEKHTDTAEGIEGLALVAQERTKHELAAPLSVQVRFDRVLNLIRIHVKLPKGLRSSLIEISTDPIGASTWTRIDGNGVRQALAGYARGTYWVRGASVRASKRSDWTGPVAVIVT